jgi:putative nucleotidyltransferase with HDIG domain
MGKLSNETIAEILKRGRIYEVGGAVRDGLLAGQVTKDRDYLVTGIDYDDLTRILRRHGRVDLVGQSFGVIKFTQMVDGLACTFDIALPRKEHSIGWGHRDFKVSFDPALPIEEDLKRRDFTINAIGLDLESDELIDPLGGQADLKARCLRMVHDKSFEEDPLRMMRAVQFAARLDFEIEAKTLEAMCEQAESITTVSAERIAEELTKLLTLAERPALGFRLMHETGLLKHILPELEHCVGVSQPGPYHKYDVFEHTMHIIDACPPHLPLRLAALFHDICKPIAKREVDGGATFYGHEMQGAKVARRVMSRLRYGKDLALDVATLVERHMFTTDVTPKGLRRLVRRTGIDLIFDLLDLRRADVVAQGMGGTTEDVDEFEAEIRAELKRKPPFNVTDLEIDGYDIMKRYELAPSQVVGQILNHLLEMVLDDPEYNTRPQLEGLADEYYENNNGLVDKRSDKESD